MRLYEIGDVDFWALLSQQVPIQSIHWNVVLQSTECVKCSRNIQWSHIHTWLLKNSAQNFGAYVFYVH